MATAVYLLCALASSACAVLLARGYLRRPSALSFWTAWCFGLLALNNLLLVVDLLVVPQLDLSPARTALALLASLVLVHGLVKETR